MIRRLRWKFVLINMSLVALILAFFFAVVMVTTRTSLRRDSLEALERAVRLSADEPGYSNFLSPEEQGNQGLFGTEKVQLPFFTVQFVREDMAYVLANQFFDTSDREALNGVLSAAVNGDQDTGDIELYGYHLRYLRADTLFGRRVAFVDLAQELSTLSALARNLTLISLGALAVFFCISLGLARWAVRPVEKSWRQQRQFVADASHELKTPLTVILSSLDMLDACPEAEEEKRRRWLENVRSSSAQMRTLVEEMLMLARSDNATQPFTPVPCDLSAIAEEELLLFEPIAFEQGKTIEESIEPGITVQGDEALLRRVLDIYLDNACKYGAAGTAIQVSLRSEGRRALLSVGSRGEPIPAEDLEHLFERFYRADPSRTREGYGLGLAIALELARLHHGKVWAQSDKEGNTFYFSLPRLSFS